MNLILIDNERTECIISRLATTHSVHPARHGGSDCASSMDVGTQGGFGIEIPDEDTGKISTVGEAVKYVEEHKA